MSDAELLLSISSCGVIAQQLAGHLRGAAGYSTTEILNSIDLPEDREVLLTAEQLASLLNVKTSTVFELSRRRIDPLPSVSIGRAKRFRRDEVDAWTERQGSRR